MSGPPFRSGSSQVASRLVVEPGTAASVGFAGFPDFSVSSSVRSIVTSTVSVPPLPSSAFTLTE